MLLIASCAFSEVSCPHRQGVYCPNVEAPRATELKQGKVKIQYRVQLDGSVSDIEVIESTGDPRWVIAVTSSVSMWRYKKPSKDYEQEFVFNAVFSR